MTNTEVEDLEEQLRQAMLSNDVAALSRLTSDNLLFVTQDGQNVSKEEDLAAHSSGQLRLSELQPGERHIAIYGDTAIVNVAMQVEGTYSGNPFVGSFRYLRVWCRDGGAPRIVSGQVCAIKAG